VSEREPATIVRPGYPPYRSEKGLPTNSRKQRMGKEKEKEKENHSGPMCPSKSIEFQ
jgi:hypothetical protein